MSWLSGWLKELILMILLASFIDLLLPNQSMQRYVRMVVGMFLLLALLEPVFQWFQKDWNADQWLAAAERSLDSRRAVAAAESGSGGSAAGGSGLLDSLPAIMAKSEELKRTNEQAAKKMAEAQLAEQMRAGLEKATGAAVAELQVRTNVDNQGRPAIEKVEVVLFHTSASRRETDRGASAADPASIGRVRVEEIRPVAIRIDPASRDKEAQPAAASEAASPAAEQLQREAIRRIEQEWGVPAERIAVSVRSPAQAGR